MKNRMNSGFIEHYKQKFIFVVGVVKVKNKKNAPKIVFFCLHTIKMTRYPFYYFTFGLNIMCLLLKNIRIIHKASEKKK